LLRALREEPVERLPVWIMRQAGRYLPAYRAVREKVDFLTLCRTPELACEVTLQPVRELGVDAAILFSDIMVPLLPVAPGMTFEPGPRLPRPVTDPDAIRDFDPKRELPFVADAVRMLDRALDVPLIGFAGAPATLATYLAEGGAAKSFHAFRRMLYADPARADELLLRLERLTRRYLLMQVEAGADAVQIFDSWGGELAPAEFERFAAPGLRRICAAIRAAGVPVIYFARGALRDAGATAYGVDWTVDIAAARARGPVQGNLDPAALFAPAADVERRVRAMAEPLARTGYVVNLGHGILPETPVESARAFVRAAQSIRCRA